MGRASSPALSETEIDISRGLFAEDGLNSDEDVQSSADGVQRSSVSKHGASDSEDGENESFIATAQAAFNRKTSAKSTKRAGAFQTMGLNVNLLKAITRKGFTVPTPIQRKTIPLILDGMDVVGMARTGSGKTAAFVIPMIEKLKAHSAQVGARAVVLSPSRELALQTLKVIKELGRGTDLRTTLLVGGDSLEEQFSSIASNPDIIIATPGRFEHLKVEMSLDLSSVKYMVFDEADRLFEMGFAAQLREIVHALPATRQTLLFSATLPKSLAEFARAGLQDPKLVRLDAESKIAPGLESAYFTVKRAEKEGALLHILQDLIKMPIGPPEASKRSAKEIADGSKKRKRGVTANEMPSPFSTIIFTATKHHVEYLANFLQAFGYATSFVYGSLDQTARKLQVQDFRSGITQVLVVTDVAARGLDIPILANVINYDFPSQPKIFIHRVGRTARAGHSGWSYSLITAQDMPYLLDLQLFLGRQLIYGAQSQPDPDFKNDLVLGAMIRDAIERCTEESSKVLAENDDLAAMREVAAKGEKQYLRTRNAASSESVKRAKRLAEEQGIAHINPIFAAQVHGDVEQQRLDMLAIVSGFRPQETVFEIGRRGNASTEMSDLMKKRRAKLKPGRYSKQDIEQSTNTSIAKPAQERSTSDDVWIKSLDDSSDGELVLTGPGNNMDEASDSELEMTFSSAHQRQGKNVEKRSWHDQEHFMAYEPSSINLSEDRGYGVHSGSNTNFVQAARSVTMDLMNDESKSFAEPSRARGLRWDKKSKKYVARANDEDGSKGTKMIVGESGQMIPASFRSGRFDAWRKANKVERLPAVGEMERNQHSNTMPSRSFRHKMVKAPKDADKYRDDYEQRKKRVAEAKEKRIGRFAEGKGRNEIKSSEDVRKARKLKARRREKNARPSKKTR